MFDGVNEDERIAGRPRRGGISLNREGGTCMRRFGRFVAEFLRREDGPTAVEYAVMLALIIVVCLASIATLGSNSSNTFKKVATTIAS
jgi:pilus assembly protein Flp/PilA